MFSSGQPTIWSIARGPDGSIYAGTGHRGRVYQITPSGASKLLWTADQPEIFAVAVDPDGVLYAATSPDGKVYRIENGKATEFFAPQAKYIWSLAFAKDGALFVGAGNPGNIYRVDKTGKAETYYETGQSHVTALAFDSKGNVLAGTEPNGILVSHQRQGQGVRALQRQPARDPLHCSHARWHHLRRGAGRLHRQSQRAADHYALVAL